MTSDVISIQLEGNKPARRPLHGGQIFDVGIEAPKQ